MSIINNALIQYSSKFLSLSLASLFNLFFFFFSHSIIIIIISARLWFPFFDKNMQIKYTRKSTCGRWEKEYDDKERLKRKRIYAIWRVKNFFFSYLPIFIVIRIFTSNFKIFSIYNPFSLFSYVNNISFTSI